MYGEKRMIDGELKLDRSPFLQLRDLRVVLKSQAFKDFAALYPLDQGATQASRAKLSVDGTT
jgi:hypothetical protein